MCFDVLLIVKGNGFDAGLSEEGIEILGIMSYLVVSTHIEISTPMVSQRASLKVSERRSVTRLATIKVISLETGLYL